MKEYYRKEYEKHTLMVELAKVGYDSKMKLLANKLCVTDESYHGPIIEVITDMREALDEMIAKADHYKAKWQEECEKEETENA